MAPHVVREAPGRLGSGRIRRRIRLGRRSLRRAALRQATRAEGCQPLLTRPGLGRPPGDEAIEDEEYNA